MANTSKKEFENIVQKVINLEFNLNLSVKDILSGFIDRKSFDLADLGANSFVEIVRNYNPEERTKLELKIKELVAFLSDIKNDNKHSLFIVFDSIVSENVKYYYQNISADLKWLTSYVFDLSDIRKLALKHKIEYINLIASEKKEGSYNKDIDRNQIEGLIDSGKTFYACGFDWDGESQVDRFIKDSIWENGYGKKSSSLVNSVKIGDVIFLKSAYQKDKVSYLRVKAIGVVTENPKDGYSLRVNWEKTKDIDLIGLGAYRSTINKIGLVNVVRIFNDLSLQLPNVYTIINNLATQENKFYDNDISSKNIKLKQFWWVNFSNQYLEDEILKTGVTQSFYLGEKSKFRGQVFKGLQKSNTGDIGVIVQHDGEKETLAIFEIIASITNNNRNKITFQIRHQFKNSEKLTYEQLKTYTYFKQSKVVLDDNSQVVYQLTEDEFIDVVSKYSKTVISGFEGTSSTKPRPNNGDSFQSGDNTSENDSEENEKTTKDKIPFHIDQVVGVDKLGREPVAKAFVNLIKNDVFTDKLDHSFMVHLQGEWGSGKSSFLNFIKKNLDSGNEKWIIVNYNAWQNQHISPPWWTLIDQIYRQSKVQLTWWYSCILWIKENLRRVIWYSGWQKVLALFLTIGFILLLIVFGSSILDFLTDTSLASIKINDEAKGLAISIFTKLIITVGSGVGVIYSFSKFISTPLFMKSSKEAISFMRRASDPMSRIRTHFNKLVDNINKRRKENWINKLLEKNQYRVKERQLAIFIDDIDRCNKGFIVELLEGVQTLFKSKRVLYIIAGEKKWITTSFGNTYKEFLSATKNSDELGELFLEKAFQLSFRMPNVAESAKKEYWNYILGLPENGKDEVPKSDSFEEFDEEKKFVIKEAIKNSNEDITDPKFMEAFEDKYKLSTDDVSDLVIEEKNSDNKEIKHLLLGFHTKIDTNPRSIIRLANNYTMTRSILIAERKGISSEKIFRWLVIEDLFPKIKIEMEKLSTISDIQELFEKEIQDKIILNNCLSLLLGDDDIEGDTFKIDEIKNIIGY